MFRGEILVAEALKRTTPARTCWYAAHLLPLPPSSSASWNLSLEQSASPAALRGQVALAAGWYWVRLSESEWTSVYVVGTSTRRRACGSVLQTVGPPRIVPLCANGRVLSDECDSVLCGCGARCGKRRSKAAGAGRRLRCWRSVRARPKLQEWQQPYIQTWPTLGATIAPPKWH
jgi:hypothetical protein